MTSMTIVKSSVTPELMAFQASTEDQAEVQELILKTARWLHSKGSTQWGNLLKGKMITTWAALLHAEKWLFSEHQRIIAWQAQ